MNLKRQLILHFFESGKNNALANILLSVLIFIGVDQKTGDTLLNGLLLLNTLWLSAFICLAVLESRESAIVSRRGWELLFQLAFFYILTVLSWLPGSNRKIGVVAILAVFASLLCIYLYRKSVKTMLLNILERNENPHGSLVTHWLRTYLHNGIQRDWYQYTSPYNLANHPKKELQHTRQMEVSHANKVFFAKELQTANISLDNAEYTFDKLQVGDTIAEWLIPSIGKVPSTSLAINKIHNQILKRAFDILVSAFISVFFLSWMVPVIGLLIKMESKGPVFFRQLRSGRHNVPFWCFKFRSMRVNEKCDELQASKDDVRITRIGAFLRKTSLDEFPQFFNVLKGDMSIVGPRPHMLLHTDFYAEKVQDYMKRLEMKQGVTGWAQVKGHRGETKDIRFMKNRVEHDIWYLHNWSFWLDVRIILLTFVNIFKREENAC